MQHPGTRWLRPRNIILLVFGVPLLTFCIWGGWAINWAFTATPGSPAGAAAGLQKLVEDSQKAHADAPNAWGLVTGVIQQYQTSRDGFCASLAPKPPEGFPDGYAWPPDAGDALGADLPPEIEKGVRDLLGALRGAGVFESAAGLHDQRRFVRPLNEDTLIMMLLPELGTARALARALGADMRFSHAGGDDAAAVRDFESGLALARALSMQSTIIDRLVGQAIIALMLTELRQELVERPYDDAHLAGFEAAMHRQLDALPPITLQLEGERLSAINCVQITFTDDGHGDGRFIPSAAAAFATGAGVAPPPPGGMGPLGNLAGFAMPSKKQTLEKVNEFYDKCMKTAALPRAARRGAFNPDTYADSLPKGYVIPRLILPAVSSYIQSGDITRLQVNATYLMLSLERRRARTGAYPAALSELAPGGVAGLPPDPLSPDGFRYRLFTPGEDAAGRGYLLYSVGADGADNRGVEDPTGKMPGFSSQAKGIDWVANAPRAPRGK